MKVFVDFAWAKNTLKISDCIDKGIPMELQYRILKYTRDVMRIIITLFLIGWMGQACAMRCTNQNGNYIVQTGDDMADVAFKCGRPDFQYELGLLLDGEVWVYRQSGGAVYRVRFLQGQVTDIEFDRLN